MGVGETGQIICRIGIGVKVVDIDEMHYENTPIQIY